MPCVTDGWSGGSLEAKSVWLVASSKWQVVSSKWQEEEGER